MRRSLWTGIGLGVLVMALVGTDAQAQSAAARSITQAEYVEAYTARRDSLVGYYAHRFGADAYGRGTFYDVAARLRLGIDEDGVFTMLDSLLSRPPRGDMFWMFPFVTAWFAGRDRLPESYTARLRDLWRTYMPYRGDTENHWALYYSTLYLMAQEFPDDPGDRWFTGKTAKENFAEAEEYLIHWIDLTTTIGQGEYDSPHYLKVFIAPMALLYAYARDPAMQRRAAMMLDYLIADFAVESLNGLYGGAHSRLYEREVVEPWLAPSSRFAWFLFGNGPFNPSSEGYILAQSGYVPPLILYQIATDRSRPYVHREYKRTRHRIRNSDVKNAPVYKYTAMRDAYVLGSSQGGLLQPIQQQTWDLTWAVDDPRGQHNTLFTLHPYSSPREGTMYFAEPWDMVTELIVRSKKEYDDPTKWTGGSPYEHVSQHGDALVALYDIAEGARHPHVSGFFSKDLTRREEDASGWIFAHGGDAYIAYYPLAPYEWREEATGDWRLHSPHLKNGAVVQVAPASAFDSWDAFKQAIRALPLTTEAGTPQVQFTTLSGDALDVRYGETPLVNGAPVDYGAWPLFGGPFLRAERGSRTLEIRYGRARRVLDFNTLTITDSVDQ